MICVFVDMLVCLIVGLGWLSCSTCTLMEILFAVN